MADVPKLVWVHSRTAKHEVVCGNFGNQRTYQVVDHLFECERPDALVLFKHWEFDDRFGGQFRMPIENYRDATEEEIAAFLTKNPEREAQYRAAEEAVIAKQRAELERQIAALNLRLATVSALPEEEVASPKARSKRAASS